MTLNNVIAIDEVGIGIVAGPITAAAVWMPVAYHNKDIKDSKKVLPNKLDWIAKDIHDHCMVLIKSVSVETINALGVWKSWELLINDLIFNMRALKGFNVPVYIDGNRIPPGQYRIHAVVKGDSIYSNIAAASIVAKSWRRKYMHALHKEFPHYGWIRGEGYGTREHIEVLLEHGPSKHHRAAGTATLIANAKRKVKT